MSTKSKQQMQNQLKTLEERKAKLLKIKEAGKMTEELQKQLDETVGEIVDLQEAIDAAEDVQATDATKEAKAAEPAKEDEEYKPEAGTEDRVHLKIVHGHRFNPNTGKKESTPYTQIFSYGEWLLFKENHKSQGYSIIEVLHDPTGEAEAFVSE